MVTHTLAGPVFAQFIGAAQTDTELAAQFGRHYFGPPRREAVAMLEAAKKRNQIQADADLGMLVDLIWGACYIRLLLPPVLALVATLLGTYPIKFEISTGVSCGRSYPPWDRMAWA